MKDKAMNNIVLSIPIIISFFIYSCDLSEKKEVDRVNNLNVDVNEKVAFGLFETYSQDKGLIASAFGYIESCGKLNINKNTRLKFNDTLMIGNIYSCNKTENFKSITRLECDSVYSYKFYFEDIKLLDYELLDFLENYSDSVIHLDIDGEEVYRDTFNKTLIIFDAPMYKSNLENCW